MALGILALDVDMRRGSSEMDEGIVNCSDSDEWLVYQGEDESNE